MTTAAGTDTRPAGYGRFRNDFARLIWQIASPMWEFDDATFDRTGRYDHRLVAGGVGHNLPQEAPDAFAEAVIEVDGY
jgi:hypothetical protein